MEQKIFTIALHAVKDSGNNNIEDVIATEVFKNEDKAWDRFYELAENISNDSNCDVLGCLSFNEDEEFEKADEILEAASCVGEFSEQEIHLRALNSNNSWHLKLEETKIQ